MDSGDAISYFKKVENILLMLTILNLTEYQWPDPACVQDGARFDFIVVGGGTAGCLIASRLVERNAKVLLIEAGTVPPIESDFKRLKFPLKAEFAMTIKKTQGQTLKVEGVHLEKHYFAFPTGKCMWRAHEYQAHKIYPF